MNFIRYFYPEWVRTIHQQSFLKRGPKIVVIGGGTGIPVLLRGLKEYSSNLTAIISVADDGGSSGRLRNQLGILPPGDIRNSLVALADREAIMEEMFSYRFKQGQGLAGHSLGNLILAAMADLYGNFDEAVRQISKVLAIRGRVIPSTLEPLILEAILADGSKIIGESSIGRTIKPIKKIRIKPAQAKPITEALKAIEEADAIILGPGSIYTSIIPNLLITDLTKAIRESKAMKVYICNVMTQPGETAGFSAADHLQAIFEHANYHLIEYIVVNSQPIADPAIVKKYLAENAEQVEIDHDRLREMKVKIVSENILEEGDYLRHNSDKLARIIIKLLLNSKTYNTKLNLFDRLLLKEKIKDKE